MKIEGLIHFLPQRVRMNPKRIPAHPKYWLYQSMQSQIEEMLRIGHPAAVIKSTLALQVSPQAFALQATMSRSRSGSQQTLIVKDASLPLSHFSPLPQVRAIPSNGSVQRLGPGVILSISMSVIETGSIWMSGTPLIFSAEISLKSFPERAWHVPLSVGSL